MATTDTIRVEGLADLLKTFGRIDKQLSKEIKRELREIGGIVLKDAKANALAEGFGKPGASGRGSGDLLRGLKLRQRRGDIAIVETAMRAGFNYPKIYEFGGSDVRHGRGGTFTKITNRTATGARLAAGGKAKGAFGQFGSRAFMYPALEKNRAAVVEAFDDMLGRLASEAGFGKGGML
jgi:hypothetical protein